MSKEISISSASVLELKAELLKLSQTTASSTHPKVITTSLKIQKPHNQKHPSNEQQETAGSEIESAYLALKRKESIYDQAVLDPIGAEQNKDHLVDFLIKDSPINESVSSNHVANIMNANDPWVETTDDFGRTRLIRSSQLKRTPPLQRDDPQDHRQRDDTQDHYYNKNEIRTMGVGFYQFSTDKEQRQQQLSDLNNLRQQTQIQRDHIESTKEAKRKAIQDRKQMLLEKRMVKKQKMEASSVDEPKLVEDVVQDFFKTLH